MASSNSGSHDSSQRWPGGRQAAISVTLDNLGEAAELLRGTWPADQPVGRHFSVTKALPRVLDLLDGLDIRVTYFIEAWNAGTYPDAIREIAHRGHEIGLHGWQHEPWAALDCMTEAELFDRCLTAFDRLGMEIAGFRPPGGRLTGTTLDLLAERGLKHVSPAGDDAAILHGLAILPFAWQGIDAYYYSDGFAGLREAKGDPASSMSPEQLQAGFERIIEDRLATGGYTSVLFHPFLEDQPERVAAMRSILERVSGDDRIWCAPCREVAAWARSHADRFTDDPLLDETSWTR